MGNKVKHRPLQAKKAYKIRVQRILSEDVPPTDHFAPSEEALAFLGSIWPDVTAPDFEKWLYDQVQVAHTQQWHPKGEKLLQKENAGKAEEHLEALQKLGYLEGWVLRDGVLVDTVASAEPDLNAEEAKAAEAMIEEYEATLPRTTYRSD